MINDVLIVGNNNRGHNLYNHFKNQFEVDLYDAYDINHMFSYTKQYNIAFVFTETKLMDDGKINTEDLEQDIENTNAKIIVICSQVSLGACDEWKNKFNKNIVYCITSDNIIVLAGNSKSCETVIDYLYKIYPEYECKITDYKNAELAGIMSDCYNILMNMFCNEFKSVANQHGIYYYPLRELFLSIKKDHTKLLTQYIDNETQKKSLSIVDDSMPLMKSVIEIDQNKRDN